MSRRREHTVRPAPDPALNTAIPPEMRKAMHRILEALHPLPSDSARMRVMAAACCLYGADRDAAWFLATASDTPREPKCGRCGHVRGTARSERI